MHLMQNNANASGAVADIFDVVGSRLCSV